VKMVPLVSANTPLPGSDNEDIGQLTAARRGK
jgi:hypothetical protein